MEEQNLNTGQKLRKFTHHMLDTYGKVEQLRQAQEEAAELTVAINHFLRGRDGSKEELYGEIVDMLIILDQLSFAFDENEVQTRLDKCLDRKLEEYK